MLRGEDPAQVRNQRFRGSGRKAPSGAHLQSFDCSSPVRLIRQRPEDQGGGLRRAGPRPWCPRHRGARPRGRPERRPRNSSCPPKREYCSPSGASSGKDAPSFVELRWRPGEHQAALTSSLCTTGPIGSANSRSIATRSAGSLKQDNLQTAFRQLLDSPRASGS
jgi:hypothetical protein